MRTEIAKYGVVNEDLFFIVNFDCIVLDIYANPFINSYTYYIHPVSPQTRLIAMPTFWG